VLFKDPKLLASGRHDALFYKRMWESILQHGGWEGEVWNRRKNGEIYPQQLAISCVRNAQGEISNYVGVFSDIADRKAAEARIESLAYFDELTGLANRKLLSDRVTLALSAARRDGSTGALVYFDLDRFKRINDTLGHEFGDALLKEVASRVSKCVRETDTLCRLGGDEFVLLLAGIGPEDLEQRLNTLLWQVNQPHEAEGKQLSVSASFGVAFYPDDGRDYATLLKHADAAMYTAKEGGRATLRFFNREMAEQIHARGQIELALRRAVENDELTLVYQPQFALPDRSLTGAEALLRWHSPTLGPKSPAEFIPIAEQAGLISEIGRWVTERAFAFAARLQHQGHPAVLAVNLSAQQLHDDELLPMLRAALHASGADSSRIELEITESLLMEEADWALSLLNELKSMGFRLAIDDFGTGYSSLAYLNWMPVDTLKIDGTFVQGAATDGNRAKVCRSIISLARSLDLTTVAEGVETKTQLGLLEQAGCDRVQGYLLGRAMSDDALLAMLRECVRERARSGLSDTDPPVVPSPEPTEANPEGRVDAASA
jgi:diguanylate cyclase (GGDEF)-like protein